MAKCSATRRMRRGERGATAVEFALVLPLLIMLMLGTITGGMAYYKKISMADAVREGARFAATADVTVTTDWTDAVKTRTVAASAGELTAAQICVEPPTTTPGSCGPGPSSPPTVSSGECVIRVLATKEVEFDIGLESWTITLVQDSYALYERTC